MDVSITAFIEGALTPGDALQALKDFDFGGGAEVEPEAEAEKPAPRRRGRRS